MDFLTMDTRTCLRVTSAEAGQVHVWRHLLFDDRGDVVGMHY